MKMSKCGIWQWLVASHSIRNRRRRRQLRTLICEVASGGLACVRKRLARREGGRGSGGGPAHDRDNAMWCN